MNFDEEVDRRGTRCFKWDYHGDAAEVIPMWVADMDFRIPDSVGESIAKRNEHGVYGYDTVPDEYTDAFLDWMHVRFECDYRFDWVKPMTGVLTAIALAIEECTAPSGTVVYMPPVYYPFPTLIERQDRRSVEIPLIRSNGMYEMDFDALRSHFESGANALLFCSPHNPVGRVWSETELRTLLELSQRHNVLIISDEIHQDIALSGYSQIPLVDLWMKIGNTAEDCPVVAVTSATKSFNLAALGAAYLVSPRKEYRDAIGKAYERHFIGMLNTLSIEATISAYRTGAPWLDELMQYLQGNYRLATDILEDGNTGLRVSKLEGTYLLWIDFRDALPGAEEIEILILDKARVRLSDGRGFGKGGRGFARMNLATTRANVEVACGRIADAVTGMQGAGNG